MKKIIKLVSFSMTSLVLLAFPLAVSAATLTLQPSSGIFNRGCSFSLNVNVDAGSTTNGVDGVDGILLYTPTQFTALSWRAK
jgi:hypothetical protein